MPLYMDYNASSPIDSRVLDTMVDVYHNYYGNPSSHHQFGEEANRLVKHARSLIAEILSVEPNEVFFTSGATESNNIVILGLARLGREKGKMHIVSTTIEHKAVLEPLKYLATQGFEIELVPVGSSGRVEVDEVLKRVRPDTLLVSVMHANNETGIIQPVEEIGQELSKSDTYFHIDAAQTFGKLVEELKVIRFDLLSLSGHKIYGPQGIGALIRRRHGYQIPRVDPIMWGGGHEDSLRPGTLPVALIVGLGKTAELSAKEYEERRVQNRKIRKSILKQLQNLNHILIGDQEHAISHTLCVSFPDINNEALKIVIKDDIAISNGSACTNRYESSHVLTAMELEPRIIESTVRISWGPTVSLYPLPLEKMSTIIANNISSHN